MTIRIQPGIRTMRSETATKKDIPHFTTKNAIKAAAEAMSKGELLRFTTTAEIKKDLGFLGGLGAVTLREGLNVTIRKNS